MRSLCLVTLLAIGCAADPSSEGAGGKADGNGTCEDAKYDDGTCHVDLACAIPDLDCFAMFRDDAQAAAKMRSLGFRTVAESDPRFTRARALLDQTWEMYRTGVVLGRLAEQRLALVVIENPSLNAFVYPAETPGVGLFAVQIHTGLLDSPLTDDQLHGVVFHELTHLAKVHLSIEVADRMRRHYIARPGPEPIGAKQIDDSRARGPLTQWQELAGFADVHTNTELADLAYGGGVRQVFVAYLDYVKARRSACAAQATAVRDRAEAVTIDPLDGSLAISAAQQQQSEAAVGALRTCLVQAGDTMTFSHYLTFLGNLVSLLDPTDVTRFGQLRALDALRAIVRDRRDRLRAIQEGFTAATGQPWSAVRFYSREEQADDVSARLTARFELDETGVTGILKASMRDAAACEAALAAAPPIPYGVDLVDDHHADCWRIAHARQVAAEHERMRELEPPGAPWVPTRAPPPAPLY